MRLSGIGPLAVTAFVAFAGPGLAQTPSSAEVDKGRKLFDDCAACHSVDAGQNDLGPSLHGLFGRPTAALEEFNYSPAMKRANAVWTPQLLDQFLTDAQAPPFRGSKMPFAGIPDPADRAAVIAYLQAATT
jgi:cytochrome c2